jgi:hypothetical protein
MQIKIQVEGFGTFEVTEEKIGELLSWLSTNKAVSIRSDNQIVKEVKGNQFTGRTLINEVTNTSMDPRFTGSF